jgi:alpha-2-macroglobulin
MKDNLTRYRVIGIAVNEADKFGIGESFIVAQLPLAIRPSVPRFLNFGDKAEFSCVLQNQTPNDLKINTVINLFNLKLIEEKKQFKGIKFQVPAFKRRELKFPIETENCGIGTFRVAGFKKKI